MNQSHKNGKKSVDTKVQKHIDNLAYNKELLDKKLRGSEYVKPKFLSNDPGSSKKKR
jgi:hypothetical protein